jgi:hypothetical protein
MVKLGLIVLSVLSAIVLSIADIGRSRPLEVDSVILAEETTSPHHDMNRAENPSSPSIVKVCPPPNGSVDGNEFHRLRDRLSAFDSDKEELSRIDAEVVQAQHDCTFAQYRVVDPALVADLLQMVGENWHEQGNLGRADQLYQDAYAILHDRSHEIVDEQYLLQDWARLKLAAGEPQRAIEFAKLRTKLARQEYENESIAKEISGLHLIDALKFQAWVLEHVGPADEARAAKQEAEQLSAQQPPCIGLCGLTTRKVN